MHKPTKDQPTTRKKQEVLPKAARELQKLIPAQVLSADEPLSPDQPQGTVTVWGQIGQFAFIRGRAP